MKRKRIVIDLDPSRPDAGKPPGGDVKDSPRATAGDGAEPRRGGVAKPLIIIAVVLLVLIGGVAGGAYFWWQHFKSSPAYTLAVLADAAQRNDTAMIDSIFDTEKVTDDFISQVRREAEGSMSSKLTSALPSQLKPQVPAITPKMKQQVHDEMVKELQRLTEEAKGKPLILVALAASHFADIKQENTTALAVVNIKDEHLEITMQSAADRWRITAIKDDKLAKQIADNVVKDLPSPGTQLEDAIRKQLEKLKSK